METSLKTSMQPSSAIEDMKKRERDFLYWQIVTGQGEITLN